MTRVSCSGSDHTTLGGRLAPLSGNVRLMSSPRHRISLWILLASLIIASVGVLGISVQAQRDTAPVIKPYDPLTRW